MARSPCSSPLPVINLTMTLLLGVMESSLHAPTYMLCPCLHKQRPGRSSQTINGGTVNQPNAVLSAVHIYYSGKTFYESWTAENIRGFLCIIAMHTLPTVRIFILGIFHFKNYKKVINNLGNHIIIFLSYTPLNYSTKQYGIFYFNIYHMGIENLIPVIPSSWLKFNSGINSLAAC